MSVWKIQVTASNKARVGVYANGVVSGFLVQCKGGFSPLKWKIVCLCQEELLSAINVSGTSKTDIKTITLYTHTRNTVSCVLMQHTHTPICIHIYITYTRSLVYNVNPYKWQVPRVEIIHLCVRGSFIAKCITYFTRTHTYTHVYIFVHIYSTLSAERNQKDSVHVWEKNLI